MLVVGAGGLGSPALMYLAAAGIGTIGIADNDTVDLTNLQRQIVHTTDRVGQNKVESAIEGLAGINPEVRVVPYKLRHRRDQRARRSSPNTTSSSTAATISRRATSSTMRASWRRSR